MRYPIGRIGLVALVTCAVLAGCGSSSKPKLSKAQFLTQANAICRAGNAKTNAQGATLGAHPTQKQVVDLVEKKFVPEIQAQITSVRALAVQTADKSKLTSMLDIAQSDLDNVKANPAALLSTSTSPFHNFAVQARPYGLTECASGS
jgi:hypothetical protein